MPPAPNRQTISISNRQICKIAAALRKRLDSTIKSYLNMGLVPIIITVLGAWRVTHHEIITSGLSLNADSCP